MQYVLRLLRVRSRILLALLATSLVLPALYIAASSHSGRLVTREYQYSHAKEAAVEVQAVLASLAQTMDTDELNSLRDKLKGVVQSRASEAGPLEDYMRVLSEFSDKMVEIDTKLSDTRASLSSGNGSQAAADLEQLRKLRDETKPLLKSLYSLLDRLAAYYKIDVTSQMEKIRRLDGLFQTYAEQIDEFESELETQQGLIQTTVSLYSSRQEVFIEETLLVYGFLRTQNGSALTSRVIAISWGPGSIIVETTDPEGEFEANIFFATGFPAGPAEIEASFEPKGHDAEIYLPSKSLLQVRVAYYASAINAEISPANVRTLDFADVKGNLSTVEGTPLAYRMITALLDGSLLGNTTTDSVGLFFFRFQVQQTLSKGSHNVTVIFTPFADRFAQSNVTLLFIVESLKTQLQISLDRASLFSGTNLAVYGTVTYLNGTAPNHGQVTIYVDEIPYGGAKIKDDGSFLFVIRLPFGLTFGSHSIRVEYNPSEPWVESSESLARVFVYNTPLIIIAVIGIPTACSLGVGVYMVRRVRRGALAAPLTLPAPPVETPLLKEEFAPESLISAIEAEGDHASKVRRSYRLAQTLIDQKLGEEPRESETHWEYFSRIAKSMPNIKDSLKRLVELFELAEYSPYPIENLENEEAKKILLKIKEKLEAAD